MKKIIAIILVLCTSVAVMGGTQQPLANENKEGLYSRSILQVIRLEPEEIDIGTAALIVSEQWSDMVAGRRYQMELDNMAIEIRSRAEQQQVAGTYKVIPLINEYLFEELAYSSLEKADDPNDLFLHHVMDNKKGYCLSLSILYLAIGERLGLPLYGVVVPGHFFIRYDDGQIRFNIETTGNGGTASDEHYMEKFNVPEEDEENLYLKNLNPLQTLGCFFNNLGNSYMTVENYEKAQEALEQAVKINPSLAESRMNLGNIYLNAGRIDDAIYEYRYAVRYNRDDALIHNNLGNAYAKKGWLSDAISEYKLSQKLKPEFIEAYKNLAIVYSEQKSYERAAAELKNALQREPKDAQIYLQLGDVYRKRGFFAQAIDVYKKALGYDGSIAGAYFGMALCHRDLGETNEEISAYKNSLVLDPSMAEAHTNLGNAYFNLKKFDESIKQYKLAAALLPGEALIYYNIGAAYSNKAEYNDAISAYLKAVELDQNLGDAHYGLAYCYYIEKQYEPSLRHLRIAETLGILVDENLVKSLEEKVK